ncbi:MAG: glycosyltransferase family 39 protein [Sporomusaceae bacterium]|nr:glycosyltransferase family 39 protein [Sporomusaceae bacterium]
MKFNRITPALWFIIAISLFTAFFQLGQLPLLDPDEPVYGETPREMLLFNDWLSPRIYGDFWYDKPPLFYWLVAFSFKLFGINEFAARFPSALLAVATVILIYQAGRKLFDERTGLLSALVLTTMVEFFYLSKAAVTDMTLLFCLTASLLGFLLKRYWLLYLFAGLATLAKGPIGLVFPGTIIFLYLLAGRRWAILKQMQILRGCLIYLLVAAPWYGFMAYTHGSPFIDTFFGYHNVTRFTSPEHPEGVLWYYYIPVMLIGFLPWTSVLVQAVKNSLTSYGQTFSYLQFLNIWGFFILLFFSISQTKLVSYILPMYPPLALVIGWYLNRLYERRQKLSFISWPIVATVLLGLLGVGLVFAMQRQNELQTGTIVSIVLFVFAVGGLWAAYLKRSVLMMIFSQAIPFALFSAVLVVFLVGPVASSLSMKSAAENFKNIYDGQAPIYVAKFLRPGFAYYTHLYGQELDDKRKSVSSTVIDEAVRGTYFVVRYQDYTVLNEKTKQSLQLLWQEQDKMILIKQ